MSERLRVLAREVFAEALAACTVTMAVQRQLAVQDGVLRVGERAYKLSNFADVRIVAIGKAGATLFDAVRPLLGAARPVRALVSAPVAPKLLGEQDKFFAGGHPLPNLE